MKDLRKNSEQAYRQSKVNERAEHENLVNQFNKDEEQENLKNLLFGTGELPRSDDADGE